MKSNINHYEITNVPFICYGEKIDDPTYNHYYNVEFTKDFGVFKKGEILKSIVINFHKGTLASYDENQNLVKEQKFDAVPITSEKEEIVGYNIKDESNLPKVQKILKDYLIDYEIWDKKRDMTKEGKTFAIHSAFYDVFVRNGLLEELYRPVYFSEVNTIKEKDIQLRNISIGELELMFLRLSYDVLERPEYYKEKEGIAIDEFFVQENYRRNLLTSDGEKYFLNVKKQNEILKGTGFLIKEI